MSEPENTVMFDVDLGIDPGRVLFGLSRIGYNPPSALCDIIDNSVRFGAKNIKILIVKQREEVNDSRKNNVKEYLVIDDGKGMDDEGLKEALKLGSTEENYESNSLSKFGLGLKSAAFSQGDDLHLISSSGESQPFKKYVVSLSAIKQRQKYFATQISLSDEDKELISQYLPDGKGTIVRIANVRLVNHPSVKKTIEELTKKVGVIYYYFMQEDKLHISINEEEITLFDVLFVDEANQNGNLNENDWDGKSVRWIEKPKPIVLDAEANVKAKIEVTQLPYPPIFELDKPGEQRSIREIYNIEAGNYGYYVYRNKRLISWAESFGGIIPQDQELYSFRGRILIDESADDSFNIDVKKSTITLSDEASNEISDRSDEYKRKSRKAWKHAKTLAKQRINQNPNSTSNSIVANFEPPDILPGEPIPTEQIERERSKREKELAEEMQSKLLQTAVQLKSDAENRQVSETEIEEADLEVALKGDANPEATKIYRVTLVEDNALWEPYYDPDHGACVRINKGHRFARLVFDDNSENIDLQVMFELFLLQMAASELRAQKSNLSSSTEQIRKQWAEYRRVTSEYLADMCRQLEGKLPPLGDL